MKYLDGIYKMSLRASGAAIHQITEPKNIRRMSLWTVLSLILFALLFSTLSFNQVKATINPVSGTNDGANNISGTADFSSEQVPTFSLSTGNLVESSEIKTNKGELVVGSGKIDAKITRDGQLVDTLPEISTKGESDQFEIKVPNNHFKPGRYQLEVNIDTWGNHQDLTQDFTWGVLALNTNQSSYEMGEKATFGMGVLNDQGITECDAKVKLTVSGPDQEPTILSTEDQTVAVSPNCGNGNYTTDFDYSGIFTPQSEGTYKLLLEAENSNGKRTMDETFQVTNSPDFVIKRTETAMRIDPKYEYTVNLGINAQKNYDGNITEKVPASFEIKEISDGGEIVDKNDNTQTIVWEASMAKGGTLNLSYKYQAPDISPEFYLLGPAEIYHKDQEKPIFAEPRAWQIAVDPSVTFSGTCKQYDQSTACTNGGTVTIYGGTSLLGTATIAGGAGAWTTSIERPAGDTVMTIYMVSGGTAARRANTVFAYDGTGSATGIVIYEEHLVLGGAGNTNATITNTEIKTYDNSVSGNADIFFEVDANNDLTVDATGFSTQEELYLITGKTYRPDSLSSGNVTTHDIQIVGTVTADGNTFYISGSWVNSGTFTYNTSTVDFNGAGSETVNNGLAGHFQNLIHSGAGTLQLLTYAIQIESNFTNSAGTFDTNSIDQWYRGNYANSATVTMTAGISYFAGGGTQTLDSGGTGATKAFYHLIHNGAGTLQLTGNTLEVDFYFQNTAGTFDTNSIDQWYYDNYVNSATVTMTAGTSYFKKASGTQTLDSGGTGAGKLFNNLTHSGAGTLQLITNAIDINGIFTNSNGTFDANDLNINVADDFLVSGGSFSADVAPGATTQTVTFDGTNEATVSGSNTFNNLVMNTTTDGAKTIKFTISTIQTISGTWTLDGASGKVLTLRSTSDTTAWGFAIPADINPAGDYIDVKDSQNNTNAYRITAGANTTDNGNNVPGWLFAANYTYDVLTTDSADYPTLGETITVNSTVNNHTGSGLTGTYIDYVIFIDANASNAPDAGETYVTSACAGSGSWSSGNYTFQKTGLDVGAGSTANDVQSCSNSNFPENTTYTIWSKWWDGASITYATKYVTFTSVPTLGEVLFVTFIAIVIIGLLIVLRRKRFWLLYYLLASLSLTLTLVFLARYFGIDQLLVNMASFHVELISKYLFKMQMELLPNGRFQLMSPINGNDILKLGIECSAIIESSILVSLLFFLPIFSLRQRFLRILLGLTVTYAINILRLLIIVLIANKFGSDYIFLAHAAVARIFFFFFELLLYWYLFTKPTVKSVGYSIIKGMPLGQAARSGQAVEWRYTYGQVLTVLLIFGLIVTSFKITDQWKIAFSEPFRMQRLTNNQTSNTPSEKEILGEGKSLLPETLSSVDIIDLLADKSSTHKFRISENSIYVNFQVSGASQPLEVELYLNNEFQNRTMIDQSGGNIDQELIFKRNIVVSKNDIVEIRIKNNGQSSSSYKIELIQENP